MLAISDLLNIFYIDWILFPLFDQSVFPVWLYLNINFE